MTNKETILVAEDDKSDALFLERAFAKVGVPTTLQFVRDGQEVIDYLLGKAQFADRLVHPGPDLLLLDLKMAPRGWVPSSRLGPAATPSQTTPRDRLQFLGPG